MFLGRDRRIFPLWSGCEYSSGAIFLSLFVVVL